MNEATTRSVPESADLRSRTQSSSQTTVSKPGSESIHLPASSYPPHNLQDDFVRHNPMEMFPEASSTVPNATATQLRILERCADPRLGGSTEQPLQLKRLSPDALISLSQNTTQESPQPLEIPRRTSPPFDDDLLGFGIQQEVYNARPSRSRSQKSATSHLIDSPSQTVNANNTRKRRRTRNDTTTESTSPPVLPNGTTDVQNDITGASIEPYDTALDGADVPESDSVSITPVATTRIVESTSDQGSRKSPVKVQVVIPKKTPASSTAQHKQKTVRNKPKRRKTSQTDPEAQSEIPVRSNSPMRNAYEEQAEGTCSKEVVAGQALPTSTSPPADLEEHQLPGKTHQAPEATVPKSTKEAPNMHARDSEKKAKLIDQSPSNSTKVPHRVGLSRKQRIAPLLRVLGRK